MNEMEDPKFRAFIDDDGENLILEWDDDHPDAALFQEWTEDDWIIAIKGGSQFINIKKQSDENG